MELRANITRQRPPAAQNPELALEALIASGIDSQRGLDRPSKKGRLKGLCPFRINSSPSPFQGEGDKGDEVLRQPLESYLSKLDALCQEIRSYITADDDLGKATALFTWLWQRKPGRYEYHGSFRLTQVIDAQLDP